MDHVLKEMVAGSIRQIGNVIAHRFAMQDEKLKILMRDMQAVEVISISQDDKDVAIHPELEPHTILDPFTQQFSGLNRRVFVYRLRDLKSNSAFIGHPVPKRLEI
jgi:hypothetical protein